MLRGRKPLPTHLKVLRGNPGHQILPKAEPEPDKLEDVPDAPDFLHGYACDEWYRIAKQLCRINLLTAVDLNPLAAYCQAYARWRTAEEALADMAKLDPLTRGLVINTSNSRVGNPLVGIAARSAKDMVRFAAEFGFTPSARSRIDVGSAEGARSGKFDGFLGG